MRPWLILAALNGALSVGLGAYAAHGLAADAYAQGLADKASHYQMIHALAILAADRLAADGRRLGHAACALFLAGILCFSGSLYFKALSGSLPIPLVTPTGGILFILGWLALAAAGNRRPKG